MLTTFASGMACGIALTVAMHIIIKGVLEDE